MLPAARDFSFGLSNLTGRKRLYRLSSPEWHTTVTTRITRRCRGGHSARRRRERAGLSEVEASALAGPCARFAAKGIRTEGTRGARLTGRETSSPKHTSSI